MEKIKELCRLSKAAWDAGNQDEAAAFFLEAQNLAGEVKLHQLGDGHIGILTKADTKGNEYNVLSLAAD